jgi:hypothetical protein
MPALATSTDMPGTQLIRCDNMCRAIDEAYEVDEVKDIRDKALAWEIFSRQAKNIDNEYRACEIRLRAERKAGVLLREREKATGTLKRGTELPRRHDGGTATLNDLGISEHQSRRWQKLADVPQPVFDEAIADRSQRPTTNGIIKSNTPTKKVTPVSDEALWLWGRLRDFDRHGLLTKDPRDVLLTMTQEMLDDVHTMAPRVASWLKRIGVF